VTPQSTTILKHLKAVGHITPVEAAAVYKARHLPSKIFEIKEHGYPVVTTIKRDLTGQKYASYSLNAN
jgi:hypothetical protein